MSTPCYPTEEFRAASWKSAQALVDQYLSDGPHLQTQFYRAQLALIEKHFPRMDPASQERAKRTVAFLESKSAQ